MGSGADGCWRTFRTADVSQHSRQVVGDKAPGSFAVRSVQGALPEFIPGSAGAIGVAARHGAEWGPWMGHLRVVAGLRSTRQSG